MSLLTAADFIYNALRKCGQLRPGYKASPELMADGLDEWKAMFDSYNSRRTMAYSMPDSVFPVPAGGGHGTTGNGQTFGGSGFTIGPSAPADFLGPRPEAIARCNLYLTSASPSTPTRIPLSQLSMEEWTSIVAPVFAPINVATCFCYDPQYPNGVLWVWPPLNGNSLEIFTWGFLTPPTSLAATFSAPPGYADVVIWDLARRLWPLCTKDMMPHRVSHQWLCGQAAIARKAVQDVNRPMPRLATDFRGGVQHNTAGASDWSLILTGVPY